MERIKKWTNNHCYYKEDRLWDNNINISNNNTEGEINKRTSRNKAIDSTPASYPSFYIIQKSTEFFFFVIFSYYK